MVRGTVLIASALLSVAAAVPSLAAAAQRYADPAGAGSACTQAAPCSLNTAVTGATNTDEVILLPSSSTYDIPAETSLTVPTGVEVHGQDGQPRPTILGDWVAPPLDMSGTGITFQHLRIQNSGPALYFYQGLVVHDVIAVTTGGGTACTWAGTGTMTDSVCWGFGPMTNQGTGAGSNLSGGSITTTLRNVTAVGGFRGMSFSANNSSGPSAVDGKNVIAFASTAGEPDIQASAFGATSSMTLTMSHSNYNSRLAIGSSGGTASITDPATNNNQTDLPQFVDLATGDFHQAALSPTVNAGTTDASNGPTDFDGEPRSLGTGPDIGADELGANPVAVDDSPTLDEDVPTTIDVIANDTDADGGQNQVVSNTAAAHGTATITGGGNAIRYQPSANYCGPDTFDYTLNGGDSATVSLTVNCVDDAPVAVGDSATVAQDAAPTPIDVLANDTDVDAGPKAVASKNDPAHGTVAITGGGTGVTYQPTAGYCGADSFSYSLNGGSSATVSVTVTCAPPDTLAPGTSLLKKPAKVTRKRRAKFRFASTEAGSTFLCKLDRRPFRPCRSPATFTVRPGKHRLRVKAIDAAGNVDATPASYRWKVLPPP